MLKRVDKGGVICEEEFNRFRYCFCGLKREYWEEICDFLKGDLKCWSLKDCFDLLETEVQKEEK
jgi:hypothetical protein